jgi:hypothetical protein|tara:strand:- start:1106 stop:1600 length:495 start_codon:yes stop_codon:yes gene_type:complete
MKALLALHESTTEEIIGDLLQIDPQYAKGIAGQLRLSQILELVQEIKSNNIDGALDILQPYIQQQAQPMEARKLDELTTDTMKKTANTNLLKTTGPELDDGSANSVKGEKKDTEKELATGQPTGKGKVTFTSDTGEVEQEIPASTGTRFRMARQSPGANVRNIG